jgi:hypothetical protein
MRRLSKEAGFVIPLVALCLAVLMGFAGIAVDVGFLEYRDQAQESATDAAAMGASQALASRSCASPSAATSAADTDAASNGFTNGGNIAITVFNPPQTGPYAGNNCAVSVQIATQHVATFFSRLFGYAGGMNETTSAVGLVVTNANGCVYLLNSAGTPDFHGAKMAAPGCALLMNGSPTFSGGDIDFSFIGYAGSDTVHGTKFEEASPEPMLSVADPCPEITGCNYLANNPPSTSSCGPLVIINGMVSPGCYTTFGGSFTMNPGLYVLTGNNSLNGSTVTGSGVTLYVTSTATAIDFHGSKLTLSACTTSCSGGAVANVLYYQVPANNSALTLAGPTGSYSGLIYAPTASVTYDGNGGSGYTVMVFDDWTLNGTGGGMTFASPPPNQSLINEAVLAE